MRSAELVTAGEAFEDLIFVGLPRLPRPGEEIKTSTFMATVGGGAIITAVAAGVFDINVLGDMTSVGTLAAFAIVCLSVIYLRRTDPGLARPFRVPLFPVVPILGVIMCLILLLSLMSVASYYLLVGLERVLLPWARETTR